VYPIRIKCATVICSSVPAGLENHPVVNVSWRDAQAYCEWLSNVSGKMVRLPIEAEWEKATRWDQMQKHSRLYPWGDEWAAAKSSTLEEGPGRTTSVGLYPDGLSPNGLLDVSGNVLKWTQSQWKDYPYNAQDGREELSGNQYRVVRGSSWGGNVRSARCADRISRRPDYRLANIG
jgi:formylglycine-generating enzyme required for sulfatase activity